MNQLEHRNKTSNNTTPYSNDEITKKDTKENTWYMWKSLI